MRWKYTEHTLNTKRYLEIWNMRPSLRPSIYCSDCLALRVALMLICVVYSNRHACTFIQHTCVACWNWIEFNSNPNRRSRTHKKDADHTQKHTTRARASEHVSIDSLTRNDFTEIRSRRNGRRRRVSQIKRVHCVWLPPQSHSRENCVLCFVCEITTSRRWFLSCVRA